MITRSHKRYVETLPPGWQSLQIVNFAQISAGGKLKLTKKNNYIKSGTPAFSASGQDGYVSITESNGEAVILSSIGANCGKAFLAKGEWTTLANTTILRPKESICLPTYLWHVLDDSAYWPRSGTAQPFISPHDIKRAWVPIPPLSEQQRICEELHVHLTLIDTLNRELKLYKELLDSIRSKHYYDTFPPKRLLGDIAKLAMGETLIGRNLNESGIPVYSASNSSHPWGQRQAVKKPLKPGAVIIGARGTIGYPKMPKDSVFASTQTTITMHTDNPTLSRYIYHLLSVVDYNRLSTTQAVPMLTVASLSGLVLPIPSVREQKNRNTNMDKLSMLIDLKMNRYQMASALYRHLRLALPYGKEIN